MMGATFNDSTQDSRSDFNESMASYTSRDEIADVVDTDEYEHSPEYEDDVTTETSNYVVEPVDEEFASKLKLLKQEAESMKQDFRSAMDASIVNYENVTDLEGLRSTRKLLDDYRDKSTFRPEMGPLPLRHKLQWFISLVGVYVLCLYAVWTH